MTEGAAERDRNFDRLLTFVDAIVAIAITLLVLPLVELAPEIRDGGDVGDLLRDHSDELWAFALSFYVIARIWLSQHHAVAPLLAGNPRITVLLIAWTFTIVVLPFPTSLVASAGGQAPTKVLYVGTMAAEHPGHRWRCARRCSATPSSPTGRRTPGRSAAWSPPASSCSPSS